MNSTNRKDKIPVLSLSTLAHSLVFTFSESCPYKKRRQPSQVVEERKPSHPEARTEESMTAAIAAYLADAGHQVTDESFKVVYYLPRNS